MPAANAQSFQPMPGEATEIASGGDRVYVVGTDPVAPGARDHNVYSWNGSDWDQIPNAGAERVAVDSQGNPWVINSNHEIFTYKGKTFVQVTGAALDIGAGSGRVYIVGTDRVAPGARDHNVYSWNGSDWDQIPNAGAERVALDLKGTWVINSQHDIYYAQMAIVSTLKVTMATEDLGPNTPQAGLDDDTRVEFWVVAVPSQNQVAHGIINGPIKDNADFREANLNVITFVERNVIDNGFELRAHYAPKGNDIFHGLGMLSITYSDGSAKEYRWRPFHMDSGTDWYAWKSKDAF
jgi:hypothetical protein